MDPDWTASALFSPSKARVQQAQAKDWASVDAWLSKRYGSRLPTFERNEDTLQALLALANLNEGADEQRAQVERIEKAALQSLSKHLAGITEDVIQPMLVELANETHLDTLAEALVAADCPTTDGAQLAKSIIDLNADEFETGQELQRVQSQLKALQGEQKRVRNVLEELKDDAFQPPPGLIDTTAEWQRTSKQLRAKISEYEERINASRPTTASGRIENVQRLSDSISQQRARLAMLEMELKAFQDLPPDRQAARRKVEAARDHLRKLTAKRDQLFENLSG